MQNKELQLSGFESSCFKVYSLVDKSYFTDTVGGPLELNMQVNFANCASKFSTRKHLQYMKLSATQSWVTVRWAAYKLNK